MNVNSLFSFSVHNYYLENNIYFDYTLYCFLFKWNCCRIALQIQNYTLHFPVIILCDKMFVVIFVCCKKIMLNVLFRVFYSYCNITHIKKATVLHTVYDPYFPHHIKHQNKNDSKIKKKDRDFYILYTCNTYHVHFSFRGYYALTILFTVLSLWDEKRVI